MPKLSARRQMIRRKISREAGDVTADGIGRHAGLYHDFWRVRDRLDHGRSLAEISLPDFVAGEKFRAGADVLPALPLAYSDID